MTLVELLVVVTISVILLASAVPLMRPALKDAQLRESTRQLNVMCAMAKARAREIGRPVGIQIERSAPGSNASFEIHFAETPPPYSGDFVDAVVDLVDVPDSMGNFDGFADQILFSKAESASLFIATDPRRSLAKVGDFIQFENKGPHYQITYVGDPNSSGLVYEMSVTAPQGSGVSNQLLATRRTTTSGPGIPYTVFRQPIKSPLNSVQMGGGTVIDLEYSGIGVDLTGTPPGATFFDAGYTNPSGNLNDQPVVIMFEPGGGVSQVYTRFYNSSGGLTYGGQRPNGTIYLLIGKFEQTAPAPVTPASPSATPPSPRATPSNLGDLSNVWLAIGTLTGTVTTAENVGGANVAAAREIARSAQSMGGN
jgi:type II secretory pathway pseudopilin PulG